MSTAGAWSYTDLITIKPFEDQDGWGKTTYGEPFVILGSIQGENELYKTATGEEFVSRFVFWTEDARVKPLDMVSCRLFEGEQEVKVVAPYSAKMFGKSQRDDYKLVT